MKKLLFFIALLPISLYAQKVEVNLNGGAALSINTTNAWSKTNFISGMGSLQASVKLKSISIGLKGECYSMQASRIFYGYDAAMARVFAFEAHYNVFRPCYNLSLIANKHLILENREFFLGVQGGFLFGKSKVTVNDLPAYLKDPIESSMPRGKAFGYCVGIQAGCRLAVTENLGIKIELSPRYITVTKAFDVSKGAGDYNAMLIPVTAGISLRL